MIKLDKKTPLLIVPLALVIVVGIGLILYSQYKNVQEELTEYKSDPKVSAVKDKYDIIRKINQMVELPGDEEPTVATISEAHRLKNQQFFTNAKNGDKLIFYSEAKRAILYRPETNKIIELATVNINDIDGGVDAETVLESTGSVQGASKMDKNQTVTVTIFNGTDSVAKLASQTQDFLLENLTDYNLVVTGTGNTNSTYDNSLVIALNKNMSGVAQYLAAELGAKLADLPESETELEPDTDILIIMGLDYNDTVPIIP